MLVEERRFLGPIEEHVWPHLKEGSALFQAQVIGDIALGAIDELVTSGQVSEEQARRALETSAQSTRTSEFLLISARRLRPMISVSDIASDILARTKNLFTIGSHKGAING